MKKTLLLILFLVFQLFISNEKSYASPGRTDANCGHRCYTNCEKYGLKYGEYHYHNGGNSDNTYEEDPDLEEYYEQQSDEFYQEMEDNEQQEKEYYNELDQQSEEQEQQYEDSYIEEPSEVPDEEYDESDSDFVICDYIINPYSIGGIGNIIEYRDKKKK
ncbi:YHYH domain-containing protein [Gottfriedia sp. NPDC058432]|uniref:YHYH domain-containing protein n=1 Tax=Gottfriedia sp. NPDC058432 TaxID=3346497 RepID=UPI00366877CD